MQVKQLAQVHRRIGVDPSQRQQGLRGRHHVGDLLVHQLVGAKPGPAPHQHAHQKRLRQRRQLGELRHERLLARIQQIGVALCDPIQRSLEVVQIVVAVGGDHPARVQHKAVYLYSLQERASARHALL